MDTQIHIPYMCTPTFRHTHRHTCTHTHIENRHTIQALPHTHTQTHTRIQAHTCTPQQTHTEAYPWEPEDHGFLPAPAPALREPGPSFPGGAPGPALAQEAAHRVDRRLIHRAVVELLIENVHLGQADPGAGRR